MATRRSIIGLTWKKLNNSPAVRDENEHSRSPVTRSMSRDTREPLRENINREKVVHLGTKQEHQDGKKTKAILRRVSSVRDAFGTLRQKMKLSSTRRRTRLLNQSPYCESPAIRTPASQNKRYLNLPAHIQEEVKMYSPFRIDSPSDGVRRSPRTPRSIRMGIHTPKSIDFSSPNTRFKRDLEAVSQGLEELRDMGQRFGSVIKRQNSRRVRKTNWGHLASE